MHYTFVVMLHLIFKLSFSAKLGMQICGKFFSQNYFRVIEITHSFCWIFALAKYCSGCLCAILI